MNGFLMDPFTYDILDEGQCRRAYLLTWWRSYLLGLAETVPRATAAAANRDLYDVQRDAAARFLLELERYPSPRGRSK